MGSHCVKGYSTTQATVALSSGEAELYAMAKGASQALGVISLAGDFGICFSATIHCDASAALGIVNRQGLGKLRHINVRYLWLQERVRSKELEVVKVAGVVNPADLMTKHLDAGTMWKHANKLGFYPAPGRAGLAPRLRDAQEEEEEDPGGSGDAVVTTTNTQCRTARPAAALVHEMRSGSPMGGCPLSWVEVVHARPRRALVTPIRVAGVPPVRALTALRVTVGEFVGSGEKFVKADNWKSRAEAHRELPREWTGSTWFRLKEDVECRDDGDDGGTPLRRCP